MRLLLDQNLSRRLVRLLAHEYPGVAHVLLIGMAQEEDTNIWNDAAANDYVIVSKDKDFYQRSVAMGHPPKVVHLKLGNCRVQEVAGAFLARPGHVRDFLSHNKKSYLILP